MLVVGAGRAEYMARVRGADRQRCLSCGDRVGECGCSSAATKLGSSSAASGLKTASRRLSAASHLPPPESPVGKTRANAAWNNASSRSGPAASAIDVVELEPPAVGLRRASYAPREFVVEHAATGLSIVPCVCPGHPRDQRRLSPRPARAMSRPHPRAGALLRRVQLNPPTPMAWVKGCTRPSDTYKSSFVPQLGHGWAPAWRVAWALQSAAVQRFCCRTLRCRIPGELGWCSWTRPVPSARSVRATEPTAVVRPRRRRWP